MRPAILGLLFLAGCGKRHAPEPDATARVVELAVSGDAGTGEEVDPEEPAEPPPPGPIATSCEGVSLVLVSVTPKEGRLEAVLELRSRAKGHVPLMASGDGSSIGARNPTLAFSLTPNHVADGVSCGTLNELARGDFLLLAPGEKKRLEWVYPPTPSKPGRYTLQVTYQNDPTSTALGGGSRDSARSAKLRARVRTTVPCTLRSNAVAFDWR